MRKTILRIAALVLAACLNAAASAQSAGIGTFDGVVVKIGTSEPIAGVNVEMRRVEGTPSSPLGPLVFAGGYFSTGASVIPSAPNPGDVFYAQTKDDGRFVFANLKPGKYRLLAAHPTGRYYQAEYGQRNPRGPGYDFTIEEAQSLKIRLEMSPFSSVSGRVIGADGKPAAHVEVFAADIAYENGERVLNLMQGVQTDERGDYRLFWLPPGQYYVGAFPQGLQRQIYTGAFGPPGAVDSLNQTFSRAPLHYRTGAGGEALQEVYETVYHPGETNPQSARALDLRAGANLTAIDISLAAGRHPALRIRGVVIDGTTSQPARGVTVRATPRLVGPVTVAPSVMTDANGAFDIPGLMRGEYVLVAAPQGGAARQNGTALLSLGDSNIEGIRLVMNAGLSVPGRMTLDGQPIEGYRVSLISENRLPGGVGGNSFPLMGARPGIFRVSVTPPQAAPPNANVVVKSIRFGGAEVADGKIRIGESNIGDLEIAMTSQGAVVEGRVVDAQRLPPPNVVVVLAPVDSQWPDRFKTAITNLAGTFRMEGVAPGSYRLYAWPYIPKGMWTYPEFLRRVENLGRPVTVSEGATVSAELVLLPEVTP